MNAFAQVEVKLKRRYDLIPNLVTTAKGYLSHERDTFEAVTAARNTALTGLKAAKAQPGDAQKIAQLSLADDALNSAMGRLTVTLEAYPELRAVEAMQQLSEEISSTENKVAYARGKTLDQHRRGNGDRFRCVCTSALLVAGRGDQRFRSRFPLKRRSDRRDARGDITAHKGRNARCDRP